MKNQTSQPRNRANGISLRGLLWRRERAQLITIVLLCHFGIRNHSFYSLCRKISRKVRKNKSTNQTTPPEAEALEHGGQIRGATAAKAGSVLSLAKEAYGRWRLRTSPRGARNGLALCFATTTFSFARTATVMVLRNLFSGETRVLHE